MSAAVLLAKELKELRESQPAFNIQLMNENIFHWSIGLYVANPDSLYHGAYLKCQMTFPESYPYKPPSFKFTPAIYHPNVFPDGRICISILHEPGTSHSDEPSNEKWSPAQCVESVLVSIVSFLEDPNINSPANIDASNSFRDDKEGYRVRVLEDVERSKKNVPSYFEIPEWNPPKYDDVDEEDWFKHCDEVNEDDADGEYAYEEDASFIKDEDVEMNKDEGKNDSK
ncbi:unnamed protein product [Ambrosiozyma monospora]|uniref:Unnamed protein product n=1 Tax=Ambrosiozyma monospora TaxID=43982 RepID=A0ACB5U4C2_AMBMO|nr:unnamed protein product [Ambrosiozyma monospora]